MELKKEGLDEGGGGGGGVKLALRGVRSRARAGMSAWRRSSCSKKLVKE